MKPKICICIHSTLHPHITREENHFLPYSALFIWPDQNFSNINMYLESASEYKAACIEITEIESILREITHNYEIVYLNSTIEWTNSKFIEGLVRLVLESLKPTKAPIVHIHIGDTHHGDNSILSPLKILDSIKAEVDIITCNQFHHLHFFSSTEYNSRANIPKISPFTRHLFKLIQCKQLKKQGSGQRVWFGAVKSRFHHRRNKFLDFIVSKENIKENFTMDRYSKYEDRLNKIVTSRASLYIPLSSSIGFNNVAPSYILNKEVWQYPLSVHTGQAKLADIFNQRIHKIKEPADLLSMYLTSKTMSRIDVNMGHRIYENTVATTFQRFLSSLTSDKYYRDIESPMYWDSRYKEILERKKQIRIEDKVSVIRIYETLQREMESNTSNSIEVTIYNEDRTKYEDQLSKYTALVLSDLSHEANIKIKQEIKHNKKDDQINRQCKIRDFVIGGCRVETRIR